MSHRIDGRHRAYYVGAVTVAPFFVILYFSTAGHLMRLNMQKHAIASRTNVGRRCGYTLWLSRYLPVLMHLIRCLPFIEIIINFIAHLFNLISFRFNLSMSPSSSCNWQVQNHLIARFDIINMNNNFSIVITWLMSSACVIFAELMCDWTATGFVSSMFTLHLCSLTIFYCLSAWAKTCSIATATDNNTQQKRKKKERNKMQMKEKRRREKEMAKHSRSFHHP